MTSIFSDRTGAYELLYSFKDYVSEARVIRELLVSEGHPNGSLLDVGCGPADHLAHLTEHYEVAGIDLSEGFIERACERLPRGRFEVADMADFDLDAPFDVVISLFSAIGYAKTRERLAMTMRCLARHVAPSGIILIEPWFEPDAWKSGHTNLTTYDGEVKIARVTRSDRDGIVSSFEAAYVVAGPDGIDQWNETHELGLFTHEEQLELLEENGLSARFEEVEGLSGRGLIIAKKPI
ncbi:MAG: class I SAM-dependent methyltransferase [Candidatus Woesearchaeota archaeon]